MANKGQKFRSYSAELKQTILKEYFDGIETARTLGLKYDIPFKTIQNWITKPNTILMLRWIIERAIQANPKLRTLH